VLVQFPAPRIVYNGLPNARNAILARVASKNGKVAASNGSGSVAFQINRA